MPDPTNEPTPLDNFREAARGATALVHVRLPATVTKYNPATQTAEIKIVPCFRRKDATQGNRVVCYDPPPIPNVPVVFEGSGSIPGVDLFAHTYPIAIGTVGLLEVCDRSIDEWKATGADRTTPQDPRRHSLADGVFRPGARSPAAPLTGDAIDPDGMVLTGPKVSINSPDTRLGSISATDAVALATLTNAQLSALRNVFSLWTPVPNDGGAALKSLLSALLLAGWPSDVSASKVFAE